jgi:hypothetical protein
VLLSSPSLAVSFAVSAVRCVAHAALSCASSTSPPRRFPRQRLRQGERSDATGRAACGTCSGRRCPLPVDRLLSSPLLPVAAPLLSCPIRGLSAALGWWWCKDGPPATLMSPCALDASCDRPAWASTAEADEADALLMTGMGATTTQQQQSAEDRAARPTEWAARCTSKTHHSMPEQKMTADSHR